MKLLIIVIIMILSTNLEARDTFYLGLISKHHNKECFNCTNNRWNEDHKLIGYSNSKYFVGYMKNSYNRNSYILGTVFINNDYIYFTPYALLGAASGYKGKVPIGVGGLSLQGYLGLEIHTADKKYGINLITIPGHVIAVGFRFSF